MLCQLHSSTLLTSTVTSAQPIYNLNRLGLCFNINRTDGTAHSCYFKHCLPFQPINFYQLHMPAIIIFTCFLSFLTNIFYVLVCPLVSLDSRRTLQCYDGLSLQSLLVFIVMSTSKFNLVNFYSNFCPTYIQLKSFRPLL